MPKQRTTTPRKGARTTTAAPAAPPPAAPIAPPPHAREALHLTPDQIAAAALTPAEREAQRQDDARAAAQAEALLARVNGNGGMQVTDEAELPIVLGRMPAAASMQPVAPQEPFLSQPPGFTEPPLQSEPSGIVEDRIRQTLNRDERAMHDKFDPLEAPPQQSFQQGHPSLMYAGLKARNHRTPDEAPVAAADVNPIAVAFGSKRYAAGASFDWCREAATGSRHAFTYDLFDIGVLFDMFEPEQFRTMEKAIRAEVAEKADAIGRRNAVSERPIGYIAVVRGYVAKPAEIADVQQGFVCTQLRVGPIPDAPVDRYDSVRAASGDPLAGASHGEFDARNWNKPKGWSGAALAGAR